MGGCGLTLAEDILHAAFLGYSIAVFPVAEALLGKDIPLSSIIGAEHSLHDLKAQIGPDEPLPQSTESLPAYLAGCSTQSFTPKTSLPTSYTRLTR